MRAVLIFLVFFISFGGINPAEAQNEKWSSPDSAIILNFAGDVSFANHFQWHVEKRYNYPFAKLESFANADISMVNLESPFTQEGSAREKEYIFRALPEYVKILKNAGIDIVCLANNHIFDYSEQGLFDTIDHLDKAGILHAGAGRNKIEARKAEVITVKGKKLAFLAYYGLRPHSDSHPATEDSAGTALRNLRYIQKDIRSLRDSVDFIIVNYHWGIEKDNQPEQDQIFFAHKTIDYGADLIIGHHPHVWQGIERYKGKIIAYSLGNFIFGGNSRKHEITGFIQVSLALSNKLESGIKIFPVQVDYWQPRIITGNKAKDFVHQIEEFSANFKNSIF